jgi:hypothetical protein
MDGLRERTVSGNDYSMPAIIHSDTRCQVSVCKRHSCGGNDFIEKYFVHGIVATAADCMVSATEATEAFVWLCLLRKPLMGACSKLADRGTARQLNIHHTTLKRKL